MISNEMRELLSAYVDGELRGVDSARVEEWTKRDPELQRELAAYRILRRKLRDWDEAEHGDGPSPLMAARALQRVRAYVAATAAARGGRLRSLTFSPLAVAAALLVVVGAGLLLGLGVAQRDAETTVLQREGDRAFALSDPLVGLDPGEAMIGEGPGLWTVRGAGFDFPRFLERELSAPPNGPFQLGERAKDLIKRWREEDEKWRNPRETRSVAGDADLVLALVRGYRAEATPYAGLVRFAAPPVTSLSKIGAVPFENRAAFEAAMGAADPDLLTIETSRIGHAVLSPAGEVWIGESDKSGRTRIVTEDCWVTDTEFVPVVWADRVPRSERFPKNLTVQPFILGPKARQRLLTARGQDDTFLAWMRSRYGGRSLAEVFRADKGERDRTVARLVKSLTDAETCAGFAVVSDGKVLGVELFANHSLMMEFAPRLLRGYALEAGPRGLQLKAGDEADEVIRRARDTLEALPGRTGLVQIQTANTVDIPEGVDRVHLLNAESKVIGHGLRIGKRPLHITLFGQ